MRAFRKNSVIKGFFRHFPLMLTSLTFWLFPLLSFKDFSRNFLFFFFLVGSCTSVQALFFQQGLFSLSFLVSFFGVLKGLSMLKRALLLLFQYFMRNKFNELHFRYKICIKLALPIKSKKLTPIMTSNNDHRKSCNLPE